MLFYIPVFIPFLESGVDKSLSALEAEQSPTSALLMTDGLAGEREELAKLVEHLNKASTAYSMKISTEKTKLMTNNTSGINTKIT